MFGYVGKYKCYYDKLPYYAISVKQLSEPHEAGEILDNYWLIVNCDYDSLEGKYQTGDFVKVIDIRFIDIFVTDVELDNKFIQKINTDKAIRFIDEQQYVFNINIYQCKF